MYQIFRPHTRLIKGIVLPSQTDYVRRVYQERLKVLREYYQERTFYLSNSHILVRLLTIGLGSLHTSHETFVWTAADRADSLSRHFQFTNSVSYGKIWYGDFYGKGSYEIIIGDDSGFDIDHAVKNWKILTPVRVLDHPVSDFGLMLPNGKTNHYIEGLSVIYINIPLLMLQYRLFIEDQMRIAREYRREVVVSPKLYLYRYVLPGMMVSHLDHVLVNRLINLESGMPMSVSLTRSSFHQAEAGNKEGSGVVSVVDRMQGEILTKLTKSQVNYDQALANIFTINKKDALHLLVMPDMAPTRQVWWCFLLARLKHIKFLLGITKNNASGRNRMYENRLVIDLSRLVDSHVLERMLTAELLESTILKINETLELAKA